MEVGEWVIIRVTCSFGTPQTPGTMYMYVSPTNFINARRACARGVITVLTRCVSVCVCPPFVSFIERLYNILNMATGFTLYLQGFWLTDFPGKASFKSYNSFAGFLHVQHTAAILSTCSRPLTVYVLRMCKAMHRASHITLNTLSAKFDMVLWFRVICSPFASPIYNVLLTSNSLIVW